MRTIPYILLLLISSIIATFSATTYSYVPFIVIFIYGILALLYRKYMKSIQISVDCITDNYIELKFSQKLSLPVQVQYEVTYEHLISGESQTIQGEFFWKERTSKEEIHLTSAWCGQLTVTNVRIVYTDSIGLASFVSNCTQACSCLQFPKMAYVGAAPSMKATSMLLGNEEGPKERFSPYMPGDSVAAIHWALSARTQALVVRKEAFAPQNEQAISIYFNDITTVESYDAYMTYCYNLLLQQGSGTVYVWQKEWIPYEVMNSDAVQSLFHQLLSVPLQELYAQSPPPTEAFSLSREGGSIQ